MATKMHYHLRPAGPYRWAIDGYDGRGGWQVTISPKGMPKDEAKRKLKEVRARAKKVF